MVMPGLTAPGQNINISLVTSDPAWQAVKRADPLQNKGGFKALHSHVLNTAMADLAGSYSKAGNIRIVRKALSSGKI